MSRKILRRGVASIAAVAVTTALAACGAGASGAADGEIVIGHLAHKSGPTAGPYGVPYDRGLKLGVEAVNESGILGDAKLSVRSEEVSAEVPAAVTQFNKFVRDDISIMVSPSSTPIQQALAPYVQEEDAVLLSAAVGDGSKDEPGGVFALADDVTPHITFGQHVVESGRTKAVVITDGDNPAFVRINENFTKGFVDAGGQVADEISISAQDADFAPVITKVQQSSPDVIFFATLSETAGNLITQMDQAGGFDDVLYGGGVSWQKQVYETGGEASVGAEFGVFWSKGLAADSEFASKFEDEHGTDPETWDALGYQTAWLIAGAAKLALDADEDVNGETIAKYMPDAPATDVVKEHGSFPEWNFADSGVAEYSGAVVKFDESGNIVPAN